MLNPLTLALDNRVRSVPDYQGVSFARNPGLALKGCVRRLVLVADKPGEPRLVAL